MSVTLTGTGGLLQRLATFASELNRVVSSYGSALTAGVAAIDAQYASNEQLQVDNLYTVSEVNRGVWGSWAGSLVSYNNSSTVAQVDRDTPLPSKTLQVALTELKRQMVANTTTVKRPTLSTTVTAAGINKGNAQIVAGVVNQYGDQNDMVLAENIVITVSSDGANGGTDYAEGLSVAGKPARGIFDYQWPGGSGASGFFSINDPAVTGILTNGGLEVWSGTGNNTPGSWSIVNGLAGTQVLRSTDVVRGDYAARLVSDGSSATVFRQDVTSKLSPNQVLAVGYWAKVSASDGSGIVRVRLCDGSGTTLTDDAGTNLSYTRNLSANIGTAYGFQHTVFSTPRQLPETAYFEIGFSVAPSAAKTLDLDLVGCVPATLAYPGGVYLAAFSADLRNAAGDYYTVAVTTTADVHTFVANLDRFYGMRNLGLYLPSTTGSPTAADGLIT